LLPYQFLEATVPFEFLYWLRIALLVIEVVVVLPVIEVVVVLPVLHKPCVAHPSPLIIVVLVGHGGIPFLCSQLCVTKAAVLVSLVTVLVEVIVLVLDAIGVVIVVLVLVVVVVVVVIVGVEVLVQGLFIIELVFVWETGGFGGVEGVGCVIGMGWGGGGGRKLARLVAVGAVPTLGLWDEGWLLVLFCCGFFFVGDHWCLFGVVVCELAEELAFSSMDLHREKEG
jgi:hypothetical protein